MLWDLHVGHHEAHDKAKNGANWSFCPPLTHPAPPPPHAEACSVIVPSWRSCTCFHNPEDHVDEIWDNIDSLEVMLDKLQSEQAFQRHLEAHQKKGKSWELPLLQIPLLLLLVSPPPLLP